MNYYSNLLAAAAAGVMLAVTGPAWAECAGAKDQNAAGKKMDEIVANAKTDSETGNREAATGAAKPTENWFGCKPDSKDYDKCVSEKGQKQKTEAAGNAKSGKSAEKPADPSAKNTTNPAKTATDSDASTTTAAKSRTASGECAEEKQG